MMKSKKLLKSDFVVYGFISILTLMSFIVPVFAEDIRYSNSYPVWYSYPCGDSSPTSLTHISPSDRNANVWKYFSFYDESAQTCYATLHTYDFQDLSNLYNTTSINYHADTKSMIVNSLDTVDTNSIDCELYYFENVDTSSDISITPTLIASSYDCTGNSGNVIQSIIPFSTANNATLTTEIQNGNYSQSFMLFPSLNSTMRSYLDSNNLDYGIGKFDNSIMISGSGFNCITIESSNWCDMFNNPWGALKKALGEDYIGDWFYVFVFFPIPMMVFLVSRNGTYAGFVSLPIILAINTIDPIIFEISLSMLALAGAFGFYELLRKRLVE